MRFSIIIFLVVFAVVSCQTEEKSNTKGELPKKDSVENVPVIATTEMGIMPVMNFPEGFYGDTMAPVFPPVKVLLHDMGDSMLVNYHFSAWYPQSNAVSNVYFNMVIKNLVNKYFEQYRFNKGESFGGLYINAEFITSEFVSFENKYAGVLFTKQEYTDGAAHYNHGYQSFHFDFKRNKEIKLTDILIFKNGEAQKFADAFNPDPTTTIHEIMLESNDFSANRPFITNYGELYLYFSDYEKGPSMTRIIIPYSKFKGYVNPEYKYLFED